jgi:hypothetical protein
VSDWARSNNLSSPTNRPTRRGCTESRAVPGLALDGTDHRSYEEQNSMIRRYIAWRNRNVHDKTTP